MEKGINKIIASPFNLVLFRVFYGNHEAEPLTFKSVTKLEKALDFGYLVGFWEFEDYNASEEEHFCYYSQMHVFVVSKNDDGIEVAAESILRRKDVVFVDETMRTKHLCGFKRKETLDINGLDEKQTSILSDLINILKREVK